MGTVDMKVLVGGPGGGREPPFWVNGTLRASMLVQWLSRHRRGSAMRMTAVFVQPLLAAAVASGCAGPEAPAQSAIVAPPAATTAAAANPADLERAVVNGVEIRFLRRGAGAPIVFVHGGLADYREWDAVMTP